MHRFTQLMGKTWHKWADNLYARSRQLKTNVGWSWYSVSVLCSDAGKLNQRQPEQ